MALLVEVHVPLPAGSEPFDWIDEVEDFLFQLEEADDLEVFDDGEQFGEVYVFFLAGATEDALLAAARRTAALEGVPAGAFAMITDTEAGEFGMGRRVDLSR
ncbi:hypothetical protein [Cryptosporangium minutisporangium]|uniref:Uncharacterized protein n=1 Tax=Cryptosporangium minutisporangium TaxID=113569 RepID=A0ABP6T016_9ACTN